jgi:hypothetical protein
LENIVNKHGYDIEIIARDLSWEDACELEIFLIEEYGRKDLKLGSLVNLTDGGDGMIGMIPWNKGIPLSKETKQKLREKAIKRNHSEKTKEKISKKLKGVKKSAEHNKKVSEALTGKKLSEEHKLNISKSKTGKKIPKPRKIIKLSEEHKANIRAGMLKAKIKRNN